mmetsp:Transcript_12148/g.30169  ORF Transcript_12148/g.30169 Transcript_12148/m.30169 type:complete len:171 (+) Transcript_12148:136-648(+)
MLAAALKAHDEKVASGEVAPPPKPEPPSFDALTLNDTSENTSRPMYSQSLPSGGHTSLVGRAPPKPRVRPSPAPSLSLPPTLELPEPSPLSYSLLSSGESPDEGEGADDVGGMSMFEPPAAARRQHNFQYAASAPATMLWGSTGHRMGSSGLGGRTPSKTLLDAMSGAPV